MGVAAVHYFYMREFWVLIHTSPILYRYIDRTITVPLQMIEFYLILSAVSNKYVQSSFSTMRLIVTAGWSIYPAGYFFGSLMGGVNDCSLNLIYNLADFVNKIAFCLAIWQAAKNETRHRALALPIFKRSFCQRW